MLRCLAARHTRHRGARCGAGSAWGAATATSSAAHVVFPGHSRRLNTSAGLVGLPNVGKSALFNAVTATQAASSSNYPFCTIEPNVARVALPDPSLDKLARALDSARVVPAQLEVVDIAGLVRGASAGQGLGNKFLSHVQQCDVLCHVLRCFDDDDVTHVEDSVDPVRDFEVIQTELMLKDLEWVESALQRKRGRTWKHEPPAALSRIGAALAEGKPARHAASCDELRTLTIEHGLPTLLTSKPIILVCNVAESDASSPDAAGNEYVAAVRAMAKSLVSHSADAVPVLAISARLEEEIAAEEDAAAVMAEFGVTESSLGKLAHAVYQQLGLQTFYTAGAKEARAWLIPRGATAQDAAGAIHSDMARGFICAETMSVADACEYGSEKAARVAGRLRQEGRQYVCQDQDVFLFRFNV